MRLPTGPLAPAISAGAEAPRTAATPGWLGTRFVYVQRPAMEIGAIQLGDGGLGCRRVGHFDEGETARLARVPVGDEIHALHAAVSSESRMQIVLGGLITEISDKYVCHGMNSFLVDLSLSDCS
jgi:hypothetical protein